MNKHIEELKDVARRRGILQLANVLESDLELTSEYRATLYRCVFNEESLDLMFGVFDIPKAEDLRRAKMILEEPAEGSEYLAVVR